MTWGTRDRFDLKAVSANLFQSLFKDNVFFEISGLATINQDTNEEDKLRDICDTRNYPLLSLHESPIPFGK